MLAPGRGALQRIKPYVPGTSSQDLVRLYGVADSIKLSSNENPLGAGRLAIEAAKAAASKIHLYPDGASRELKEALAQHLDVDAAQIVVGCGSDELIRMLAEAYLEPDRAVVFADMTFRLYSCVTSRMAPHDEVVLLLHAKNDLAEI